MKTVASTFGIILSVAFVVPAGSGAMAMTCSADPAEPDDNCVGSATVIHGGEAQAHDFCDDATDWVRFNACAGRSYALRTSSLGTSADTVLELYGPDCSMLLASDDDGAGGHASRVTWSSPADGVYHVRVRQADGTSGASRDYALELMGDTSSCSTWSQSYGVPAGSTHATELLQLADGGYMFGGSYPVGDVYDLWLVNVDPSGAMRWQRRYGVSGDSYLSGIRQTPDGGFLVADRTEAFSGGGDYFKAWVLKLNALGGIEWQKTYGGSGGDAVHEIAGTSDGGFVMVGWTTRVLRSALWVLRADASGNVIWSYRWYGPVGSDSVGTSIQQTADGGFIVGGAFTAYHGATGTWLTKLDALGNVQWEKLWEGFELLSLVRQDRDGGYSVAGLTYAFSPVSLGAAVFMMKLDGSGTILWQESFYDGIGGSHGSNAHNPYVVQMRDGDYVIATSFDSHGWMLRLNPSGDPVWDWKSAGISGYEAVAATADGGIAAVGAESAQPGYVSVMLRKFDAGGEVASCALHSAAYSIQMSTSASDAVTSLTREVFTPQVANTAKAPIPTVATLLSDCPCYTPAYAGAVKASHLDGGVRWSWTSAGAVTYDIVRGDLTTLRATAGDFTTAINHDSVACLANDTTALFVDDFALPDSGEAKFVLLSAKSDSCLGTYNTAAPAAQRGDRDGKINAAGGGCIVFGQP